MSIRCLGYVGVQTPDPASWEQFGVGMLGMAVSRKGDDGTVYLRVDERRQRVAIHPGTDNRIRYAGWEVADEAELIAMIERLDAAGVAWTEGDREECQSRSVERFVRFADPAGLPHEVFYGAAVTFDPFVPGRPISGYNTGNLGLGHVLFIVPDAEAAHEFYTKTMGFKLSDIVDTEFGIPGYFYHCSSRHHSLAMLGMPGMAGLHHLMLEVNSLDDVGIGYDLVKQRGYQLAMELGRHSNDYMLSFYVVSPAGFQVEYGWGGREIDERTWHVVRPDRGEIWGHQILGTGLPDTVRPVEAG